MRASAREFEADIFTARINIFHRKCRLFSAAAKKRHQQAPERALQPRPRQLSSSFAREALFARKMAESPSAARILPALPTASGGSIPVPLASPVPGIPFPRPPGPEVPQPPRPAPAMVVVPHAVPAVPEPPPPTTRIKEPDTKRGHRFGRLPSSYSNAEIDRMTILRPLVGWHGSGVAVKRVLKPACKERKISFPGIKNPTKKQYVTALVEFDVLRGDTYDEAEAAEAAAAAPALPPPPPEQLVADPSTLTASMRPSLEPYRRGIKRMRTEDGGSVGVSNGRPDMVALAGVYAALERKVAAEAAASRTRAAIQYINLMSKNEQKIADLAAARMDKESPEFKKAVADRDRYAAYLDKVLQIQAVEPPRKRPAFGLEGFPLPEGLPSSLTYPATQLANRAGARIAIALASENPDKIRGVETAAQSWLLAADIRNGTAQQGQSLPEGAVAIVTRSVESGVAGGQPWGMQQTYDGALQRVRNIKTQLENAKEDTKEGQVGAGGVAARSGGAFPYTHIVAAENGVCALLSHSQTQAVDVCCVVVEDVSTGTQGVSFSQSRPYPLADVQEMIRSGVTRLEIGEFCKKYYAGAQLSASRADQVESAARMAFEQLGMQLQG